MLVDNNKSGQKGAKEYIFHYLRSSRLFLNILGSHHPNRASQMPIMPTMPIMLNSLYKLKVGKPTLIIAIVKYEEMS